MVECPKDATDWRTVFTSHGLDIISVSEPRYISWASDKSPYEIKHCYIDVEVVTTVGNFLYEPNFNDGAYNQRARKLWYSTIPGYYLSPYDWTSAHDWYSGVKPCTNLPENAHYTGPGTPDAPDGSITDANDCLWTCDTGYGRVDDECVPLCDAGITRLHAGNVTLPLFPQSYSSPRLVVEIGDRVCYGVLRPGRVSGTINVDIGGVIYHGE